jgi:hypothetical protein
MLRHSIYKKFGKVSMQDAGLKKDEAAEQTPPTNPLGIPAVKFPNPAPFVSNLNPTNIYDVNQETPAMDSGPLTQAETTKRGVMAPAETPQASDFDAFKSTLKQDVKNNWQDYATLGMAGVSAGLNYKDDIRRQQQLDRSIQTRGVDAKPLNDYNWMYGRTTSGGTEYQPTIMAQYGANLTPRYAQGGMNAANVEIEGGEFLILPDGTTEIAKGPSHKNGGIDTVLPEGTKVFSNHLRPMDLHKMKPEQKMGLVNRYMQEGGDTSMGLGLDYIEHLKSKAKAEKEAKDKQAQSDAESTGSKYKDRSRTFAELAKKYDLKQFQEVLDNPYSSAVDKQTAEILVRRNSQILEQLFRDQQILNGNSNGEPMAQETQMAKGGIANPGFESLPGYVQAKIISNMQSGGKKYKLPDNAVILDEKDQTKANVGDYVRSADGTIKKVTKKDVKQVQDGFNRNYADMEARWNDPKMQPVKDAMYQKYVESHSGTKVTPEQFHKNYMNAQKQVYAIQEARRNDPNFDATSEDWDKTAGGMKNKKYRETAQKLGFTPLSEDEAKQFQAGYKDLADLQNDPEFAPLLSDFDLRPKGVGDQMYSGKAISGEDAIFGNTTAGQAQYLKKMKENPELAFENVQEEIPDGQDYNITQTNRGTYQREPFPTSQLIPGAYGLAQSQEVFPYAIPEVAAPYVRPQTLNIQSQLQDADNNATAAMRYGADPNMAYIAGLDAKQKAFQTKQNYDADGRWKADLYNADSKLKADLFNAEAFNSTYNDMYSTALSNQSESKQAALANLSTQRSKWNQEENIKELGMNTYAPSLDKRRGDNSFQITPGATTYNWNNSTTSTVNNANPNTQPTTQGAPAANPNANPSLTGPNTTQPIGSRMMRTGLDPNLPPSMQMGPVSGKPQVGVNPNSKPVSPMENLNPNQEVPELLMGVRPKYKMGGELDNYLNPFKKKKVKGFNKK